ncbi:MAG: hypothetical protein OXI24_08135 [Candidatus Poribacteria bacterium]|nr:hypothetical protein [Candidatus Poribacteria bacterium]
MLRVAQDREHEEIRRNTQAKTLAPTTETEIEKTDTNYNNLPILQDLRKSIKHQTLGREKCKFYIFKPPKSPLSRGL